MRGALPPARPARFRSTLTGWGVAYLVAGGALGALALVSTTPAWALNGWGAVGLVHLVLARLNLRGLRLALAFQEPRTREDRAIPLDVTLHRTARGAARALRVEIRLAQSRLNQRVAFSDGLPGRSEECVTVPILPRGFGSMLVLGVRVSSRFPFALYRLEADWDPLPSARCIVWPRAQRLTAKAGGAATNDRRAWAGGAEPSLEVRPYRSGDPTTTICWKSSARTGRLHVRPRVPVARQRRTLLVDPDRRVWRPMTRCWKMIYLASALLEDGYRRQTLRALQLGERVYPLGNADQFIAAMDALALLELRPRSALPESIPTSIIRLIPQGEGIRVVDEAGALLDHVS